MHKILVADDVRITVQHAITFYFYSLAEKKIYATNFEEDLFKIVIMPLVILGSNKSNVKC